MDWLSRSKKNIQESVLLGGVVFLLAYPNLYYFSIKVFYADLLKQVGSEAINGFLLKQCLMLVALLILCAYCGLSFSERHGLPGLGMRQTLQKWKFNHVLFCAVGVWIFSYIIFDRKFMMIAPQYYPKNVWWAFSITLRASFLEELVFHFGMLTVAVGALKRVFPLWVPNGLVAGFYALVITGKTFQLIHFMPQWEPLSVLAFAGAFATSYFLGVVTLKHGLIAAIYFHFLISLKYVVYALAMNVF